MADGTYVALVRDLASLGRGIPEPAPSDHFTSAVMDRVAALPPLTPSVNAWTRAWRQAGHRVASTVGTRRRRMALVVAAVVLALLAAPPVRAVVADWFGFGGVLVEKGDVGGGVAPPPKVAKGSSVAEAAAAVDFTVWVPEELGVPDGVEASPDGRMVSMSWSSAEDGVIRLDQFGARFDFSVLKTSPSVFYAAVGGTDALWFEEPHEVVLLEPDGSRRTESARLAGHTLIWLEDLTTLRLEGDLSLQRAVEIAESIVEVD
jgi:hypothetical protein